jgi:Protein of unknown function (DUF642)
MFKLSGNVAAASQTAWVSAGRMAAIALLSATAYLPMASAASLANGSFENGGFVDGGSNYMQVPPGSNAIGGWKVATSDGSIAWAKSPTADGLEAADGTYFIDLTGLGATATNGAVSQKVSVAANTTYTFTINLGLSNDSVVTAKIGNQLIVLTAGTPFMVGGTTWVPHTGTFAGGAETKKKKLVIRNTTAGGQVALIDGITIAP